MDGETQRFFYHTSKTRELDNLLGDIYHKILGMFFLLVYIFHGVFFLSTMTLFLVLQNFADRYGKGNY